MFFESPIQTSRSSKNQTLLVPSHTLNVGFGLTNSLNVILVVTAVSTDKFTKARQKKPQCKTQRLQFDRKTHKTFCSVRFDSRRLWFFL